MAIYIKAPAKGCPTCDSCAADVPCPAPAITSELGPISETINVYFEYQITASGNPTSFGATGLPTGLSINTSTGLISGAITSCGTVVIGITATNSCGTSPNKGVYFVVTGPSPVITSATKRTANVGDYFSYFITATNSPTSFSVSNNPSWMSINTSTGELYGTVTDDNDYHIEIFATNSCGTGLDYLDLYAAYNPQLVCDSISATGYKFAFQEYTSPSSPPKIYLRRSGSGTMNEYVYGGQPDCSGTVTSNPSWAYSGYQEYNLDGTLIVDAILENGVPSGGAIVPPCGVSSTGECLPVITKTAKTFTGDQICYGSYPAFYYSGTVLDQLSNEYTTAMLIAHTESLLPSYPNTYTGNCLASRDLESDELTYSISRFKYKFLLPVLTGYSTYQITWNEGTTPMTYNWDGYSTQTPVYTANEPSTNGSYTITSIVASGT